MKRLFFAITPIGLIGILLLLMGKGFLGCQNRPVGRNHVPSPAPRGQLIDSIAYLYLEGDAKGMIRNCQKFGELSLEKKDDNNWVWARCMVGLNYRNLNQIDSLTLIAEQLLEFSKSDSGSLADTTLARVHWINGLADYMNSQDFSAPISFWKKTIQLAPNHPMAIVSQGLLGNIMIMGGEVEKGSAKIDSALNRAKKIISPSDPYMLTLNLQNATRWTVKENYGNALAAYQEILLHERQRKYPNLYAMGIALMGAEQAALYIGQQTLFLEHNDSLLAFPFDQIPNGQLMKGTAHTHRAFFFQQAGDMEEANQWARRGLQMIAAYSQESGYIDDSGNTLAKILIESGRADSAIAYLQTLIQAQIQYYGNASPFLATSYSLLVTAQTEVGAYDSAMVSVQKVKKFLPQTLIRSNLDLLNVEIGLYIRSEQWQLAKRTSRNYKGLLGKDSPPQSVAIAHQNLALIARKNHQQTRAITEFRHAWKALTELDQMDQISLHQLSELGDVSLATKILFGTADQHYRSYQKNGNLQTLRESIQLLNQGLHLSALSMVRHWETQSAQFHQDMVQPAYQKALSQCWLAYRQTNDSQWLKLALDLTNRNKSQQLRQSLREEQGLLLANVDQELQESIKRLSFLIAGKKGQIQSAYGNPKIQAFIPKLEQERFDLEQQLQALMLKVEKESPDFFQMKFQVTPPSAREIQTNLPEQTALLSYTFDQEALHLFVIGPDTMMWHRTPVMADTLFSWIDQLSQMYVSEYSMEKDPQQLPKYASTAFLLYQTLIKPVERYIESIEHLHISPEGPLFWVPFDALVRDDTQEFSGGFESLAYLLHSWEVSYTYSVEASLLPRLVQSHASESWMGWGPFSPDLQRKLKAKRNRTEAEEEFIHLLSLKLQNELLQRVAKTTGGRARLGGKATKSDFLQHAGQTSALHIGGHGLVNVDSPQKSALIFAPTSDGKGSNRLSMQEIASQSIPADFVFIASCKSSAGLIQFGEGMLSIARSFQLAGCQSLIANRWDASSRETAMIAELFYEQLLQHSTKSAALNHAKRSFLADKSVLDQNKHPRYWAVLSLIGETGPWTHLSTP